MQEPQTWIATIAGGGECTQEIEQSLDQLCRYLHITNIALGPKAVKNAQQESDGPHTVGSIVNGEEVVLCTLVRGLPGHQQHQTDALFDGTVTFKNHGKSPVFLSGYWTVSVEESESEDEDDDEMMLSDDDESEDSDDEVPMAVPIGTHARVIMKRRFEAEEQEEDEAEESEEDEDEDEDEEDEDEESEEEEEEEAPTTSGKPAAAVKRAAAAAAAPRAKAAASAPAGKKAKSDQQEPQKQKQQVKQQAGGSGKDSKGPTAATPAGPAPSSGAAKDAFEKAVVAHLAKQPGRTARLVALGSAVPRPLGVPKVGVLAKARPDLFKLNERDGTLTLIK